MSKCHWDVERCHFGLENPRVIVFGHKQTELLLSTFGSKWPSKSFLALKPLWRNLPSSLARALADFSGALAHNKRPCGTYASACLRAWPRVTRAFGSAERPFDAQITVANSQGSQFSSVFRLDLALRTTDGLLLVLSQSGQIFCQQIGGFHFIPESWTAQLSWVTLTQRRKR